MNKLLVIGAGIGQIEIIKKAKKSDCYVVVVTSPGDWPGISVADEVWLIDIYDREKILEKAKENNITAVISDQNDLMMPTVAYIAEKLGLPGNAFKQVYSYCNKNIFRNNCDLLGIPCPKHIAVKSADFDCSLFDCQLPWIVKPADSQSSIGVKKIIDFKDLKTALIDAINNSKTKEAIIEEYFVGKELVCEGFIEHGEYHNLNFADRKYFSLQDLMIPSQTLFPSTVNKSIKDKIIECETKMARYINPAFGITHSEYLYNEMSNEIRVVETALRGGGVFISSHLVPFSTGIDINQVLLEKALNKRIDVNDVLSHRVESAAGYVCFYLKEGIIESIEGVEKIKSMPFVKMVTLNGIEIGVKTSKMTYKGARKGPILIVGNTREELESNILTVQETLIIKVNNNGNVINGIVWE